MNSEKPLSGRLCPICNALEVHEFRPFCSKRCADLDLSRWLGGVYAVPVVQLDESDADELERFIEENDQN
ncbi:MAG: DNA gyrase inhibitor YacG [Rhodospirillaceae bacterium]|jgi:endogenous inhibitor of DNA gyrase (YacG/DUF329 family)